MGKKIKTKAPSWVQMWAKQQPSAMNKAAVKREQKGSVKK